MDGNINPGIRHRTTIDAAKLTYTTTSLAGQKRTFDEHRGTKNDLNLPVLADVTNRLDLHRSSLRELKASEIHDISPKPYSEYSQRRALALTPGPTSNPLLDLSNHAYGLPQQLVENLANLGIRPIYPWQSECLLRSGALRGEQNLVYAAPTGGGKSLVADILMLKRVIESQKKALLVLPYVALVQEKLRWLRKIVDGIPKIGSSAHVESNSRCGANVAMKMISG